SDARVETGLLFHLAKRGLLERLAVVTLAFGQSPVTARAVDDRDVRLILLDAADQASGREHGLRRSRALAGGHESIVPLVPSSEVGFFVDYSCSRSSARS